MTTIRPLTRNTERRLIGGLSRLSEFELAQLRKLPLREQVYLFMKSKKSIESCTRGFLEWECYVSWSLGTLPFEVEDEQDRRDAEDSHL